MGWIGGRGFDGAGLQCRRVARGHCSDTPLPARSLRGKGFRGVDTFGWHRIERSDNNASASRWVACVMMHSVVQSDINLARRMLDSGCLDSGIIAYLCWRGVDRAEATRVVELLRQGLLASAPSSNDLGSCRRHRFRSGHKRHRLKGTHVIDRSWFSEPLLLPGRQPWSWSCGMRAISRWGIGGVSCLAILGCILYVGDAALVAVGRNLASFHERRSEIWLPGPQGQYVPARKPYDFGEPLPSPSRSAGPDLYKAPEPQTPPPFIKTLPFVSPLSAPSSSHHSSTANDSGSKP
jgi:hypothetical protein